MAHFLTLVLVDPADPQPAAHAERLMMRYWSDVLVDEDEDEDDEAGGAGDAGDGRGTGRVSPKCDGFTVGGRYDGLIWGKEQHYNLTPAEFRRRYGLDVVRPEDNVRPVPQLVPDIRAYAVITPDGAWHEQGEEPLQEWRVRLRSLLDRHRDQLAVAIDCHC